MSKNIGNQNHEEEENNMNATSATQNESDEEFWKETEPKPDFLRLWDEIEGYSKFRSLWEMQDQEAFFILLLRNEQLRNNKSIKDLKKMAAKYAKECSDAAEAAWEKTDTRVSKALRQRGIGASYERSMGMNEEEIKDFMNYVRESEWLQYVEQTAEEIEQMLMRRCSPDSADSIIERTIEESELHYGAERFGTTDFWF